MRKFWKYLATAAVVMAVTPLMSCDDDDDYSSSPGRPDYSVNRVYMLDPESEYSTIEYKASGEFINQLENPLTLTQIRCTRPAPEDVTVTVEIDPSLAAEYNAANDKDYELMQGAKLVNTTFTIPRGEFLATEKLAIDFEDRSALVGCEKDLVLPVAITKVTGGLVISKTSRFFIVFDFQANELTPVATSYVDVDVTESGWQSAYTNTVINDFITAEWGAEFPVNVSATVDNSLIASYNATNGTDYKEIEATVQPVVLAKGETKANLSIRLGNYTGVNNDETYVVPLKLAITSGVGAALATDVVYVVVRKMHAILSFVSSNIPSAWTKIQPQNSWSATLTQNGTSSDWTAGITSSKRKVVNEGDVFEVDFGADTKVGGMGIEMYSTTFGMHNITDIEISSDGENWIPVEGCYFGYVEYAYMKFNKAQTFRYIRFACGTRNYSAYRPYVEAVTFWNI